jgi:hypothetical protein
MVHPGRTSLVNIDGPESFPFCSRIQDFGKNFPPTPFHKDQTLCYRSRRFIENGIRGCESKIGSLTFEAGSPESGGNPCLGK